MHLRQPTAPALLGKLCKAEFTYSASGQFTKTKEKFKNFKKQEIQGIFIKKNLVNLVFNMTLLTEVFRIYLTASDKVLRDNTFNIKTELLQWFINVGQTP